MAILKKGAFAHNPNTRKILKNPSITDGYSKIENVFNERLGACDSLSRKLDEAVYELNKPIRVTVAEVDNLLTQVYAMADNGSAEQSILKPVFISVIDGAMRSFKVSSKLGLTPSRVYDECVNFTYETKQSANHCTDSLTEFAHEQHEKNSRGRNSELKAKDLRDQNKMKKYKDNHFNGKAFAQDEYNPESIVYINSNEAFKQDGMTPCGKEMHPDSAETDHIVPCKVICERLKGNKGLTQEDIRSIVNNDGNLAVTSHDTNREKGKCTNTEFVKKHADDLTDMEKQALLHVENEAIRILNDTQNKEVTSNLRNNDNVQKMFLKDAGGAALAQAGGQAVLYILKPIYFEMKDSIQNGIEEGVSEASFTEAMKVRFGRVKNYIFENSLKDFTTTALDFLKSFVSVLIEAIIGCLVGVFKMIWRLIKEGFKIITGAVKILADKNKTVAEKGDAILQLASISISAVAGIYIDGAVKNFGIPEPWSMLLASVVSAIVASGILYLLNKLDVFNTNREIRKRRILEILDEINEQVALEAQNSIDTTPHNYATN